MSKSSNRSLLGFCVKCAAFTAFASAISLSSGTASAGTIEVSAGFNYNRTQYSETSFTWTRRWGASFGYHISERSEIEVGYSDEINRNKITGYEDTTFHDQIYSANWVQSFMDKNDPVQPYFKIGVGQLNRSATGNYAGGGAPPAVVDSVSGILGAGVRIYLFKGIALRSEATSYLSGGSLRTWKDSFAITFGLSVYY